MKQTISVLLALLICTAAAACMGNAESTLPRPTEAAQLVNPMIEVKDAQEVAQALGIAFPRPGDAQDEQYFVISNQIGHAAFTRNGRAYVFRGAKNYAGDISGLYVTFEAEGAGVSLDAEGYGVCLTMRFIKEGGALVSWRDGDVDYTLYAPDETARPDGDASASESIALAWALAQAANAAQADA